MAATLTQPTFPKPAYDRYRFGDGPEPVLQLGTHGWTASDFEDRTLRGLWDAGRYEIINGVLTIMPAAFFGGGSCVVELIRVCTQFSKSKKIDSRSASEVDIELRNDQLIRADGVVIFGDDVEKFKALKFANGRSWLQNNLIIPPTLVIESVSHGHEKHDRQTKRGWYAEFGVRHYWIVDSLARRLDCLLLVAGQYVDDGQGRDKEAVTVLSIPGLTISLREIWGDEDDAGG